MEEKAIDRIDESRGPHYEPYGWHHWPEHPWMSYQFRRALGETQEGGGSVSECFLAASRMTPGDNESWHVEWTRVGDSNRARGDEAAAAGSEYRRRETAGCARRITTAALSSGSRRMIRAGSRPSRRWKRAPRRFLPTSRRPAR